jgi:hypothetical protein
MWDCESCGCKNIISSELFCPQCFTDKPSETAEALGSEISASEAEGGTEVPADAETSEAPSSDPAPDVPADPPPTGKPATPSPAMMKSKNAKDGNDESWGQLCRA